MENLVGIKELYDVNIRLNKPLEIGKKKYDINESILSFSIAEIAQIQQAKTEKSATGGYLNNTLINWSNDREVNFAITHGVLSPKSWSILSNSKLSEPQEKSIPFNEEIVAVDTDEYCYVDLKHIANNVDRLGAQPNPFNEPLPMGRRPELLLKPLPPSKEKWIFCYDAETGRRIRDFEVWQNRVYFKEPYRKVLVDYTFTYENGIQTLEIGNRLMNGFVRLEGKMSAKD